MNHSVDCNDGDRPVFSCLCCFQMLDGLRASVHGQGSSLRVETQLPHFVLLNDDFLVTDVIIYPLREGMTLIGTSACDPAPDITVHGPGTEAMMGYIKHTVEYDQTENRLRERVCRIKSSIQASLISISMPR
jgi:hypothetical protein